MGWQDSHLHLFRIAGREYGPAFLDDELKTLDEKQFRIGDLAKTGDLAGYEHDFADGREHEHVVEASAVADAATVYPAGIHTQDRGYDGDAWYLSTLTGTMYPWR